MPARLHPNGIGESLGDVLVTAEPFYTTGQVWYVHNEDGDDAYDGLNPVRPFETFGAAYSAADDGDTIVLLDGHQETFTAQLTIGKQIVIVASGQSDGKPTVKLTNNSAADNLWIIDAMNVEIRNIWFEAQTQANSDALIHDLSGVRVVGCYFECGQYNGGPCVRFNVAGGYGEIRNTRFVSTVESAAEVPEPAVTVTAVMQQVLLAGVTFDGGQYGFAGGYAYVETEATVLKAEGLSLLRGADMRVHEGTVAQYVMPTTATGNARIDWDGGVA